MWAKEKLKLEVKTYRIIALILGSLLILTISANVILVKKIVQKRSAAGILESIAKPILAQEVYPLFYCPCCGRPLDKDNICCGLARERIHYIDSLVLQGFSKDEIILAYVKKYGSKSFVDEEMQKELYKRLVEMAPADRPIISLSPQFYDIGDVSQDKGITTAFFELKNKGNKDLIIDRLETSCGCTSASIIYKGEESPKFNMAGHGVNEEIKDWQIIISPQEIAQVKVYYDPNVHEDFRGTAIREIYIYSNDPINFQKKIKIELNQVD